MTDNQTRDHAGARHPQVHTLGGVTVFVFPLLHPAAALRTPRCARRCDEDFAALPELLEAPPLPRGDGADRR